MHNCEVCLSGRGHKLHLTSLGSERWVRHLLFRDYLRGHPETAAEYARLRRDLAQTRGADGQRYVAGKTAFDEAVLNRTRRAGADLEGTGGGRGPITGDEARR